jgi:hypothetical protein
MRTRPTFSFLVFVLLLAIAPGLRAALEKDLGQTLAYLRINDAQADLGTVLDLIERRPALVLDLRSVIVEDGIAEPLQAALIKRPLPRAVRIILINSTTAPALIAAVNAPLPNVITMGPRTAAVIPDVAVATSDEDDRRGFAALAAGTPVEKLINDTRDKRRYDEARLVHDHANGVTPPDSLLPSDAEDDSVTTEPTSDPKPSDENKKAEPPLVVDLVLERAVQLHRSLLALKKL